MENKILKKELKKSFEFFIKEANCNKNSKGLFPGAFSPEAASDTSVSAIVRRPCDRFK
mgnify:CR=1 FL=1